MKYKYWRILGLLLFLGIGLMPGSSFGQDTTAVAPQADRLLQQMGAYLMYHLLSVTCNIIVSHLDRP